MKRYAIVRVDDDYKHICPSAFEKVDDSSFCKLAIRKGGSCNVCPYGDTKEQLINKITTALRRTWLNEDNQSFREVAEEIVEFLGVE